jgi:hypothetical protein
MLKAERFTLPNEENIHVALKRLEADLDIFLKHALQFPKMIGWER